MKTSALIFVCLIIFITNAYAENQEGNYLIRYEYVVKLNDKTIASGKTSANKGGIAYINDTVTSSYMYDCKNKLYKDAKIGFTAEISPGLVYDNIINSSFKFMNSYLVPSKNNSSCEQQAIGTSFLNGDSFIISTKDKPESNIFTNGYAIKIKQMLDN